MSDVLKGLKPIKSMTTVDVNGLTLRAFNFQMNVFDARGWGYLTGRASMGLTEAEAEKIQHANLLLASDAFNVYALTEKTPSELAQAVIQLTEEIVVLKARLKESTHGD